MRGLVLALGVVFALAVVQTTAASDSWTDPAGDARGAPDLRGLYLQDNWVGKKGYMSLQPSVGTFSPGTVTLEIDADSKASTGASGGSDYRVVWDVAAETGNAFRWNGSRFVAWKSPLIDVHSSTDRGVSIYARAIGNPKKFRLWLHSARGARVDRAPSKGYWTHEVPS